MGQVYTEYLSEILRDPVERSLSVIEAACRVQRVEQFYKVRFIGCPPEECLGQGLFPEGANSGVLYRQ
jgi:hypothetical protein